MRGAADASGHLALEITRASLEVVEADGKRWVADSEVVAATVGDEPPQSRAIIPLLEALRGAPVTFRLDPMKGLASVDGLDAALQKAVARDPSLGDARDELRSLCSDDVWLRDLVAAGLTEVPRAVAEGGNFERRVTVHVPGRGDTPIRLSGAAGKDTSGLAAVRSEGTLTAGAAFAGEPGAAPPDEVGAVTLGRVSGRATTSFAPDTSMPSLGEWTLTTPFAGGLTLTATTTFTLVVR